MIFEETEIFFTVVMFINVDKLKLIHSLSLKLSRRGADGERISSNPKREVK